VVRKSFPERELVSEREIVPERDSRKRTARRKIMERLARVEG
jgi:hypothetical protein